MKDHLSLLVSAGGINFQLPNTADELAAGRDALRRTRENSAIFNWQRTVSPEALLETEGWARSVSLDLLAQWRGLEENGQFRFTPPTHVILALEQALKELHREGGVAARGARYRANQTQLADGMRALGFREYLPRELQGNAITTFRYLEDARFSFDELYRRLSDRGFVIYPGKVSEADTFRIGTIGNVFPRDVERLLAAIRESASELALSV